MGEKEAVLSVDPILDMQSITKQFPGVTALSDVEFKAWPGEVMGLLGENGAGKSTLIKVLGGVHPDFEGNVMYGGSRVRFSSPRDAQAAGISVIHQELSLVPAMTVAENIFLGKEPRGRCGQVDRGRMNSRSRELLRSLDIDVDVTSPVEEYPISVQQMIEVAKALSFEANILVMDEPTSALREHEVEQLFRIVRRLRDSGVAIVYITHKMEEIYEITDRITVLRDGKYIGTARTNEISQDEVIQWMVGRKIDMLYPEDEAMPRDELLRIDHLNVYSQDRTERKILDDVSLEVRKGEIVGLAGLRGAGNSELLHVLFGDSPGPVVGDIYLRGKRILPRSPQASMKRGIALLTDDRKASGLVLTMSVLGNMTMSSLPGIAKLGFLNSRMERRAVEGYKETLDLKAASLDVEVNSLSGGNQQKVLIAKWLMTEPGLLMLDQPTRGIDVGAKAEIYRLMIQWKHEGKGILLITTELPELLAMSDRIVAMHRGKVTARFSKNEATQENVMAAAMSEGENARDVS
jgi:ABC-type sugar transport system ATPase subunit